jgi:LemA protein
MGFFLGLLWFFRSWRRWKVANKMSDTPTSPPSAVPVGRAESTGKASLPAGYQPVGRGQPSVWYEVKLEQYVRSNKSSHWRTVWSASSTQMFHLTDDYGHVEVDPVDAEVHLGEEIVSDSNLDFPVPVLAMAARTPVPTSPISGSSIMTDIKDYRGTWRIVERFLPLSDQTVTIYGPVQPTSAGSTAPRFKTPIVESRLPQRFRKRSSSLHAVHIFAADATRATRKLSLTAWVGLLIAPMLMSICGFFVLFYFVKTSPSSLRVLAVIPMVISYTAIVVRSLLNIYNRLVGAVNQVESAWSMLDVALARRSSLLPQLSSIVAESMRYENMMQSTITSARWDTTVSRTNLDPTNVSSTISAPVSKDLSVLLEKYPELKTSSNVSSLQSELSRSENLIAGARLGYNDSVAIARTKLESFPSSLFASRFKTRRAALWTC